MKTVKRAVSPNTNFLNILKFPILLIVAIFGIGMGFVSHKQIPAGETPAANFTAVGSEAKDFYLIVPGGKPSIGGSQSAPGQLAISANLNFPIGGQKPPSRELKIADTNEGDIGGPHSIPRPSIEIFSSVNEIDGCSTAPRGFSINQNTLLAQAVLEVPLSNGIPIGGQKPPFESYIGRSYSLPHGLFLT